MAKQPAKKTPAKKVSTPSKTKNSSTASKSVVSKPKTVNKSSSDTTKVPTPYKTVYPPKKESYRSGNGKVSTLYTTPAKNKNGATVLTHADSTKLKSRYNNTVVEPARLQRNTERAKEGKAPLTTKDVYGNVNKENHSFSEKGKNFKDAPLKSVTVKKKK